MAGLTDLMGGFSPMDGGNAASTRSPVFGVAAAASSGGGLGGLMGDALSFLGMASAAIDPWKENTLSLTVKLALAPEIDSAELVVAEGDSSPEVSIGDRLAVSLGYADSGEQAVCTGAVNGVHHDGVRSRRISLAGSAEPLCVLRVNQAYDSMTCGEIVNDLIDRAGCTAGCVEDGITLAVYVVDDRMSAWAHIARLGLLSGCWAWCAPDGSVNFRAVEPSSVAVAIFTWGLDPVEVCRLESGRKHGSLDVVGDGSASKNGKSAWYWPAKDLSSLKSSVGDGGGRAFYVAGLRDAAAVKQAGMSLASRDDRQSVCGTIRAPGSIAVTIGDTVELVSFPQKAVNGLMLVTGIRHSYSRRQGFMSELDFCKASAGSGMGGLGLSF